RTSHVIREHALPRRIPSLLSFLGQEWDKSEELRALVIISISFRSFEIDPRVIAGSALRPWPEIADSSRLLSPDFTRVVLGFIFGSERHLGGHASQKVAHTSTLGYRRYYRCRLRIFCNR